MQRYWPGVTTVLVLDVVTKLLARSTSGALAAE